MTTPLIPAQVRLGARDRTAVQISPDGTRISWIGPVEGVRNVWVAPLDDLASATAVTKNRGLGVTSYFWGFDNEHLIQLTEHELFVLDLGSGQSERVAPFDNGRAQLIGRSYLKPDTIVVGISQENSELRDVYELTLSSLELVKVCDNPGFVSWVADHRLAIRGAVAPGPDGGVSVLARASVEGAWQTLFNVDAGEVAGLDIQGFDSTGTKLLIASAHGANASRLLSVDAVTGEQTVIYGHPLYDVSAVGTHPTSHAVQVVTYVAGHSHRVVLDPALVGDVEMLDREFGGDDWRVVSREISDATWLVSRTDPDESVDYFAYDRIGGSVARLFGEQDSSEHVDVR